MTSIDNKTERILSEKLDRMENKINLLLKHFKIDEPPKKEKRAGTFARGIKVD